MNKLFLKIATLTAGVTMAIGVGVGLSSHKEANRVLADGTAIKAADLQNGDKCFIVCNNYVLKAGASFASKGSGNRTAIYDAAGLSESEAWLFKKVDSIWTISTTVGEVDYFLYVTNDNNGLVCGTSSNAGTKGNWTIASTNPSSPSVTTSYLSANDGTYTRYLAYYKTPNFRCYKNTSVTDGSAVIQLYKYSAPSKTVSSISVTTQPTKTEYDEGDVLDLSGVVITATWSDSTSSNCTADANFDPADGSVLSAVDTSVTVTYGGKTTSISLTIHEETFDTSDLYITAEALGLNTSYASTDVNIDVGGKDFVFGRKDVLKNSTTSTIQLKATTGSLYNKSKFSSRISKIYFLADADGDNAPSNWKVCASTDTAGVTSNSLSITTVDSTNRIYSVDFSGGEYYFFNVAKTGSYATYFDMIVVELAHSDDDMASVRTAATNMLSVFSAFCSGEKGPSDEQWNTIEGYYSALTSAQKAIFDATVLNVAPCNGSDAYGAPVQGTDLQKAVQKIEYCVKAYDLDNFTSRDISSSKLSTNYNNENSSEVVVIVIISCSLLLTVAVFFALKKKRLHK